MIRPRLHAINVLAGFTVGLLCAFGGAWKDAPYEGFKPLTFIRSIWVGTLAGVVTCLLTENFWIAGCCAGYMERAAVEGWKILRGVKPGKFDYGSRGHLQQPPAFTGGD